jgi:hypothetical protein
MLPADAHVGSRGFRLALEQLNLPNTKKWFEQFSREVLHMPAVSALTMANNIQTSLADELKTRKFFAFDPEDDRYYERCDLAGAAFRDNWKSSNDELKNAGNCLVFGCWTSSVFHSMRALEHGLIVMEKTIPTTPPTNPNQNTWGNRLQRIKQAVDAKGPAWPERQFYEQSQSFFWAAKSGIRDETMHLGVSAKYEKPEAVSILDATSAILRHLATKLKE